ncbi:MAG: nucleotidyl transferase AbiEii/AbiGii toxin family protein [Lachnospiraceae bacterium]|nr:nucleotidyl transferase AbiEii/AbiGii toxin family protein [Lachnospiraceae bacterium]
MMDEYSEEGLTGELASSRVCQDIVLKAIAEGPFSRNVTIKGGVVMRSLTQNSRRATQDIDLDFIHYSLDDISIRNFVEKLNCIDGIQIEIQGEIKVLKHQDYHGKSIEVVIHDEFGNKVNSKSDIGVHKHLEINQEEYCFDVCMDDEGATLLKNTVEQSFVEKLRSLLKFGPASRRYKDIYDMFFLKDIASKTKLLEIMELLVFSDDGMYEKNVTDIVKRVSFTFKDEQYLRRVSGSRQRWLDNDIHEIASGIILYLEELKI